MSFLRYALPAFAAVGSASAACSVQGTTTIQNAGDAGALATCTTFTGSVAIATGTTDNIAINNVRAITGDLVAEDVPGLTQLSGDSLTSIGGAFTLQGVQILADLSFPRLVIVDTISWGGLPNLQSLDFTTGIQNATSVDIENTGLQSLDGVNLGSVNTFTVVNNGALQTVSLNVTEISGALDISYNGDNTAASFPNLNTALNMTFRSISNLSIPRLETVNGSFGVFESQTIQYINAPNLTEVEGTVSIINNEALANISFPSLTTIGGGFQIQKNPALDGSLVFPELMAVAGALDFYGNFTDVQMPALSDVKGAFNIQTSGDVTDDCTHFNSIKGRNNVIKGPFACISRTNDPKGAGSASGTSSGSGAQKTGAAGHLEFSHGLTGAAGVLAAILAL